jgi:radial spoke head protein 4A
VQWTKLPNVTMDQIVKARLFKRFMTGNLDAAVPSYPPFDGTEKNLLRAQIARIVGATSISPDGFFDLSEDDPPEVKVAEAEQYNERFPKSSADLKDPEGWKHHEVELNKLGRLTAMPEQLDDNGEPVEVEDPVDANPPLDAIKPENWTFRVGPGGSGSSGTSVVVARSLQWPGAIAVSSNRKFSNIYVGSGLAFEVKPLPYSPPLPSAIQQEWAPTEESIQLVDQDDVRVDPTPPRAEGEEEEE